MVRKCFVKKNLLKQFFVKKCYVKKKFPNIDVPKMKPNILKTVEMVFYGAV